MAKSSTAKAKNNLSSFDIQQIEAELRAIESEGLTLESSKLAAAEITKSKAPSIIEKASSSTSTQTRDVNVVNFNPESSTLLHRAVRGVQPSTHTRADRLKKTTSFTQSADPAVSSKKAPQPLKFKNASDRMRLPQTKNSMDFKAVKTLPRKPLQDLASLPSIVQPTSVAVRGLRHANQFHNYSNRTYSQSLQNQVSKASLFEQHFTPSKEAVNFAKIDSKRSYNKGKNMLGGVDQHNLGPGRARKMLSYRSVKFAAPLISILVIGFYVMYINLPGINLKMAENKSGLSISQPSYSPKGYSLSGQIETETGKVAMSYKNGDSSYKVSQEVSEWDSKALLENKVMGESQEYSAYTDKGLTIYVYDGKATWVNQGKVNQLDTGNSGIDVEEMVRIAGSM